MIALTVFAAAAAVAASPTPACEQAAVSTQDMEQCRGKRLDAANADLARYIAAARKRLREDAASAGDTAGKTLADFDKAEQAWDAYRTAECDAVYQNWSEGTIRGVMSLTCQIDLTIRHTHTVWSNWLTYMDSTPPILPEPAPPSD
jgi:uncharacterized protein YecT (DUF1311 family)